MGVSLPFPKVELTTDDEIVCSPPFSRKLDVAPSTTVTDKAIENKTQNEVTCLKVEERLEYIHEKTVYFKEKYSVDGWKPTGIANNLNNEGRKTNYPGIANNLNNEGRKTNYPSRLLQRLEQTLDKVLEAEAKRRTCAMKPEAVELTAGLNTDRQITTNGTANLEERLEQILDDHPKHQVGAPKLENLQLATGLNTEEPKSENDSTYLQPRLERSQEEVMKCGTKNQENGVDDVWHQALENIIPEIDGCKDTQNMTSNLERKLQPSSEKVLELGSEPPSDGVYADEVRLELKSCDTEIMAEVTKIIKELGGEAGCTRESGTDTKHKETGPELQTEMRQGNEDQKNTELGTREMQLRAEMTEIELNKTEEDGAGDAVKANTSRGG